MSRVVGRRELGRTTRFVAGISERAFLDPVSFVGSADIGWFFPDLYLGTDPDFPAPVRFLAEYDTVTLSHADRSRVVGDAPLEPLQGGPGGWVGTVLVDGLVRATWAARRSGEVLALEVRVGGGLSAAERAEIEAEGTALLEFLAPDRGGDVRITG